MATGDGRFFPLSTDTRSGQSCARCEERHGKHFLKIDTKRGFVRDWEVKNEVPDAGNVNKIPELFTNADATEVYSFLGTLSGLTVSKVEVKKSLYKIIEKILDEPAEKIFDELKLAKNQDWKNYVEQRCGDLSILGIMENKENKENKEKLKVKEFYVPVTIVRSDDPKSQFLIPKSDDSESRKSELYQKFQDHKKILIYGKAGIGKTTLLKHLALECLKANFKKDCIPMYISLRRLRSKELENPLANLFDTYEKIIEPDSKVSVKEIRQAFKDGRILLLVDGLDLNENITIEEVEFFERFTSVHYPDNSFIISSKTKDIIASSYFNDFQEFKLEGFDNDSAIKFVRQWNGVVHDSAPSCNVGLSLDLAKDGCDALKELATCSPLLLSCLCCVYSENGIDNTAYLKNNDDGLRLLQDSMSYLLKWQDGEIERSNFYHNAYKVLAATHRATNLISYLAIQLMKEGDLGGYVKKSKILELIVSYATQSDILTCLQKEGVIKDREENNLYAEDILNAIESQDGIIVEMFYKEDDKEYGFVHELIKKYFAALYLSKASTEEWKYYHKKFSENTSWEPIFKNAFRLRELDTEKIRNEFLLLNQNSNEGESFASVIDISLTKFPNEIQVLISSNSIDQELIVEEWNFKPQHIENGGMTIFERKNGKSIDSSKIFPLVSSTEANDWMNGKNIKILIPVLREIFSDINTSNESPTQE